MITFLENVWGVTLELAPWLLLGAAAGGLLHGLVPSGFIQRSLRGYGGVLRAVLLGVPLPLCSCGVIPAGMSLQKSGASKGASVGFLIATPQTGVDSVLVSAGMLGWPFALFKVVAALVTGVVGGGIVEATDSQVGSIQSEASPEHVDRSFRGMLAHAVDLVRMIWGWLVFGILVSAALSTLLPPDAFAGMTGFGPIVALLVVLLASVPLYVCATASVPIAAALVAGGMPTGAALVFLMAGPATNVATIGAVRSAFGGRALAIYLATIITGSIGFGLLFEALFGALTVSHVHGHEHGAAWWSVAAAVVLLGAFVWFAMEQLRSLLSNRASATTQTLEIPVAGMTCKGCAGRLERALQGEQGVASASVSFDAGTAVVAGALTVERLHEAIRRAGFEPRS